MIIKHYFNNAFLQQKESMVILKKQIKNINIVISCNINCPYCYARNNCKRYHIIDDFNQPIYFSNKLKLLDSNASKAFLLTGMSDLSVWKNEWFKEVLTKIETNRDKQFLFLTKRPDLISLRVNLDNAWFGVTITNRTEIVRIEKLKNNIKAKKYFLTFEPMFEDVGNINLDGIFWIVIGTETGKRKNKAVTKKEWVFSILKQAREKNIPVFMKEDLLGIINEEEFVQELPQDFEKGE